MSTLVALTVLLTVAAADPQLLYNYNALTYPGYFGQPLIGAGYPGVLGYQPGQSFLNVPQGTIPQNVYQEPYSQAVPSVAPKAGYPGVLGYQPGQNLLNVPQGIFPQNVYQIPYSQAVPSVVSEVAPQQIVAKEINKDVPQQVEDTPEVKLAKARFAAEYQKAVLRAAQTPETRRRRRAVEDAAQDVKVPQVLIPNWLAAYHHGYYNPYQSLHGLPGYQGQPIITY